MHIRLSIPVAEPATSMIGDYLRELSLAMQDFFRDIAYGDDVQIIEISFLLVFTRSG